MCIRDSSQCPRHGEQPEPQRGQRHSAGQEQARERRREGARGQEQHRVQPRHAQRHAQVVEPRRRHSLQRRSGNGQPQRGEHGRRRNARRQARARRRARREPWHRALPARRGSRQQHACARDEAHPQHGGAARKRLPVARARQRAATEAPAQHGCKAVAERHAEHAERACVRCAQAEREQREQCERHGVVHGSRRVLPLAARREGELLPAPGQRVHHDERGRQRSRPPGRREGQGCDHPPAAQRYVHELARALLAHPAPCEQARSRQHRQDVHEGQPHPHGVLHDRHLPSAASAAFSSRASSARASSTSAAARSFVTALRRSRQL